MHFKISCAICSAFDPGVYGHTKIPVYFLRAKLSLNDFIYILVSGSGKDGGVVVPTNATKMTGFINKHHFNTTIYQYQTISLWVIHIIGAYCGWVHGQFYPYPSGLHHWHNHACNIRWIEPMIYLEMIAWLKQSKTQQIYVHMSWDILYWWL